MKSVVFTIALAALCLPESLQARIGESIAETDKRYGEPTFFHTEENASYRSYNFKERDIDVIFYEDEAVYEFIYFGPLRLEDSSEAEAIGAENGEFIQAIMTSAYGWPEAEVTAFLRNLGVSGNELASTQEYEGITAKYYINLLKLQAYNVYEAGLRLNSSKVEEDSVREACSKINQTAYDAKQKKESESKAGGF